MTNINFSEYQKELIKAGIPEGQIYDFEFDPIEGVYQQYFNWCVDNLKDYSLTFKIEPSYFYYWNTDRINAGAASRDGKYFIRFSTGYMDALHKKLGVKGQFFTKTDWTAFHNLQKLMTVSLEYLMFQASTIFTFYHEFAHLVQQQGGVFYMNEYPESEDYSFKLHLCEYDADLNGCQFVNVYIQQFIQDNLPKDYQTDLNYKRLMYLGISSIVITQLLFLHGELYPFKPEGIDTSFYTKKSTHPHTFTRAIYIIEHYVRIAKANGVTIDFQDTVTNVTVICNEFFKDSEIFKDFINDVNYNLDEIKGYQLELDLAQMSSSFCIRHKINLFGFRTKNP